VNITFSLRCSLLLLVGTAVLHGQDLISDPAVDPAEPVQNVAQPYVPLTLGQSYLWSLHEIFNPAPLLLIAARAAIDHSENNPTRWGQGFGGYSERAAHHLARAAIRQNLAFGIRALDHEDPRYFRSHSKGVWRRAGYAAGRTFVVRSERGGNMPAYSSIVADFGAPFIAQTWRPEAISPSRELTSGAMAIGFTGVSNLGQEFWPDIRKRLRHP
jgi:hypothetical protein